MSPLAFSRLRATNLEVVWILVYPTLLALGKSCINCLNSRRQLKTALLPLLGLVYKAKQLLSLC